MAPVHLLSPTLLARGAALGIALSVSLAATACSSGELHGRWEELPPTGKTWTLADVYSTDWTKAMLACPYDTPEHVAAKTGKPWQGPDLSSRDDVQVVMLFNDERLLGQELLGRSSMDMCRSDLGDLTPDTPLVTSDEEGSHAELVR